jgi:hypothetical protein
MAESNVQQISDWRELQYAILREGLEEADRRTADKRKVVYDYIAILDEAQRGLSREDNITNDMLVFCEDYDSLKAALGAAYGMIDAARLELMKFASSLE